MELFVCVLNETERLNDVISAFVEVGASGATVIESQGMGRIVASEIPIFAGFRQLMAGARPFNYTIFSVIEKGEVVEELTRILRGVLQEETGEAKGIVFTVPVSGFERL